MEVKITINNENKDICIKAATSANHGEVLYLASPQHVDYFITIKYNVNNASHRLYLERGLLFYCKADALLFSKSFLYNDRS